MMNNPINLNAFADDLFSNYRKHYKELGIGEYHDFLEILSLKEIYQPEEDFILNETKLLTYLKLLWLKPNQPEHILDTIFGNTIKKYTLLFSKIKTTDNGQNLDSNDNTKLEDTNTTNVSPSQNTNTNITKPSNENKQNKNIEDSKNHLNYVRIDVGKVASQHQLTSTTISNESLEPFIFSNNYFPIQERNLIQLWKTLRGKLSSIPSRKIDIQKTVNTFAKQGFLTKAKYGQSTQNANNIITLTDHGGSMSSFDELSDLLRNSITKSVSQGCSHHFFFRNVIDQYLYLNKSYTKFIEISNFERQFKDKNPHILIISDAGAARHGYSIQRIYKTFGFLERLYSISSKIIWLNPFPEDRWKENSADTIYHKAKMFPITQTGLQDAIRFLKYIK